MQFSTLYLCYFGLREPLVQTQVLPYLREIQKGGTKISILTFEPNPSENWTAEQIETEKRKLAEEGIEWDFLTYHKRPSAPATLFDVLCGAMYARRKVRKEKIQILHARSHVPAMMAALANLFLLRRKPKILFDIRGFFPEEYTDAGIWKENGLLYKTVKRVEKWLYKKSDGFIVLTERAREILFPESKNSGIDKFNRPVEVIPCCIDAKRFQASANDERELIRQEMQLIGKRVFVYVGSFGGWYLTDEMMQFFSLAKSRDANTFTIILTQRDVEKAEASLLKAGLKNEDFLVKSVAPAEISKYLIASDVAISFIKACYSKLASSPTKIAEYLACGLPIISNSGVGDLDFLIENENVGTILGGFDEENYVQAISEIEKLLEDKNMREHCRNVADRNFDLERVGGERYRNIYQRILNN